MKKTNFLILLLTMLFGLGQASWAQEANVAKVGDTEYATLDAAVTAAKAGDVIEVIKAGDYKLPNLPKNVTIKGAADGIVSFTHTSGGSIASVPNGATFNNVTFNWGNVNYHGFQHAGTINMENCTLNGKLFSYGDMNFTDCKFVQDNSDYHMWAYSGNVTYKGCSFTNNETGKFINVYNEDGSIKYTVTVEDCTFININKEASNKAAINVKATCGSKLLNYDVIIKSCTTDGSFPAASITQNLAVINNLVQVDDRTADGKDNITVTLDNEQVYPIKDYVAQVGDKKYESLQDAFNAAEDGQTVTLLKDYDASAENGGNYNNTKRNLWLSKGITLDGCGHELTVTNRGIGVQGADGKIDVIFKDIAIKNSKEEGRCIDTRGKIGSLTIDNAVLSTESKEASQPLTIGGNQKYTATVKILNGSKVITSDDGKYGYAITTFNPVNMTIDGSTIKGWACLNIKAASSSAGSNGSVFNITNSELTSKNVYSGDSNAYSVIKMEDVDVAVNISNTKINVNGDKNSEAIVGFQTDNSKESIVKMGEGNEVTFTGTTSFVQNGNAVSKLVISGGKFNQPVPEENCAEGFIPADLGDGWYSVKKGSYVASIGDKKYESLEDAFAASADGDTITLLADCTGNGIKAPQGKYKEKGLTVDFDGHTYTVDGATVGSTGTETNGFQLLKDNKITFKNGAISSEKAKILVQNYSDLTLEGMTLTLNNTNYTSAYTLSNNNGNIVINGTTINANQAGGFAFDVCRYASYPSVSVTVKGESVINGDAEVSASGSDAKDGFKLMLEAGTMTGNIVLDASAKAAMAAAPEKALVMKSETFTKDAPADYKWVTAEEGTLKLVAKEYVAQIGNNKYETLEAAFAAAQDGETVTLLADCTGNGIKAPQGKYKEKGLTVDFDGHTYTVDGATVGSTGTETNGFQLLKDNKITFKNGAISSEKAKILVQNYSDLTLEGMTLTLNNTNYTSAYTLSNNNGNIVINGTTINANQAGGFAFDVCRYASYPSVSVTVSGESVINGNVEVSASGSDAKDGFSLMLAGGTMSGEIVLDASAKAAMSSSPDKAKVSKSDSFDKAAPADYKWVSNGDGTSTLKPCEYVASIGDNKYESLQEAVDAAGTTAATVKLLTEAATDNIIKGNGVKVQEGQNITFDLNGLTYNVDKTVGSKGTETNGFQLLRGSTVKFTNGTVTSNTAQILIQNYSNLTLEGVTVNAGSAGYAVSNNFGSMNVTGDTYINAKEGGVAFDLWYGMSSVYDEGIKVNFDENFTGKVTGKIEYGHAKRVTDENWQEKASLVIKAGYFDIDYAEGSKDALNGANIEISGGSFLHAVPVEYCAEGYVPTEQLPDGRYSVVSAEDAGIFELNDNDIEYPYCEGRVATKISYKRTFMQKHVNKYQAWFVPFDYTITNEDEENFQFYKIHLIAASAKEGEVQDNTKVYVYIEPIGEGTVLKGNRPYVVKPNKELTDYVFVAENINKLYSEDSSSRLHQETTEFEYDFYGTFRKVKFIEEKQVLYLDGGKIVWNSSNNTVRTYRWYIKTTSKDNDNYAKPDIIFIEEGNEPTGIEINDTIGDGIIGIYTSNGIKVDNPVKGINIIRYADGKTRKIYVK